MTQYISLESVRFILRAHVRYRSRMAAFSLMREFAHPGTAYVANLRNVK